MCPENIGNARSAKKRPQKVGTHEKDIATKLTFEVSYLNLFFVRSKELPKHFSKQNVTSSSETSSFTSDKGIFHNKTG